ncbi:rhomboid family intramembrane serine protease [Gellertiella hungarica]|uniref:Membrane associated rhomboid family serine protease n=1 Tax=Gellertiella hungarica TaxID=1572859 RepID=A0A7W6J4Y8_9HYPH|nr:rhomboid family intramembrane serine protease [Gellertiella hungarica]MBB4064875.1 membrane associated rhomboid family serine protease [Gellertiella hungarica]
MTDSIPPEESLQPPPAAPRSEPILNIPGALVLVIVLMAGLFVAQAYLLSEALSRWIDFEFGFIPARYVYPLFEGDYSWVWSPLSYSFLHGSVEHLVFNCLWLACFGTPVVSRIGTRRSVVFWIASAVAAAAVFAAIHWGEVQLVIGASGVISAFMGAACRFAFPPRSKVFSRRPVFAYPLLGVGEVLASRTAVSFLLVWLAGNVLVAVGLPIVGDASAAVAWEAHIGGLLFGFFAFPLFDRQPVPPGEGAAVNDG